jgi:magnesium-transporting ATPase (P-type)
MNSTMIPPGRVTESPEHAHGSTTGLASAEVMELRKKYGLNDIPVEKKPPLLKFLGYFWGPIPWMIQTAAILSAVIMHWRPSSSMTRSKCGCSGRFTPYS